MTADQPPAPADLWEGERVARWLHQADGLERQLQPVSELLFAAAALGSGEHVLDVGCGTGPTTRQAATLVGGSGRVTGLDVSPDMLAVAASRPVPPAAAPVRWITADAVTWPGLDPSEHVDLVLSRFGVMFFSDPERAFTALRRSTREGGRLAAAVWDRRDTVPMFELPVVAARAALEARGRTPVPLPVDAGPFSLSDPEVVTATLTAAGWQDVTTQPHDLLLQVGGGLAPDEAAHAAVEMGPTRALLESAQADADDQAAVVEAITEALGDRVAADGTVVVGARPIVVTARA